MEASAQTMYELHRAGASIAEVAEAFGADPDGVRWVFRIYGFETLDAEVDTAGALSTNVPRPEVDGAGEHDADLGKPASGDLPERIVQMYAMYSEGATLEEVGAAVNVTRERVRQLFASNGLKTLSLAGRRRQKAAGRTGEIVALHRELRDVAAVAERLGLAKAIVDEIIREETTVAERRKPQINYQKKYSNEELIACLFAARDAIGGVLTAAAYTKYARSQQFDDGRPWPTHQTFALRWGSWRNALVSAGLPQNPSSPIAGQRLFGPGHCIDALHHAARTLGKAPTAAEYDCLAKQSGGALPSQATVRTRLGGWTAALIKADL